MERREDAKLRKLFLVTGENDPCDLCDELTSFMLMRRETLVVFATRPPANPKFSQSTSLSSYRAVIKALPALIHTDHSIICHFQPVGQLPIHFQSSPFSRFSNAMHVRTARVRYTVRCLVDNFEGGDATEVGFPWRALFFESPVDRTCQTQRRRKTEQWWTNEVNLNSRNSDHSRLTRYADMFAGYFDKLTVPFGCEC